jgi:hypothetical protein
MGLHIGVAIKGFFKGSSTTTTLVKDLDLLTLIRLCIGVIIRGCIKGSTSSIIALVSMKDLNQGRCVVKDVYPSKFIKISFS